MPLLDQMLEVPPSLGHAQLRPVAFVPGRALCRLRVKVGRKVLHHLLHVEDGRLDELGAKVVDDEGGHVDCLYGDVL